MPVSETVEKTVQKPVAKPAKPKKVPVKTATLEEAKALVLEMRKSREDWQNRKIVAKAHKILTGAKKGKNVDVSRPL